MFGEQQLKTLVTNLLLLYVLWSSTHKIQDTYLQMSFPGCAYKSEFLEGLVKYVRHSPALLLSFQIVAWSLRVLFLFNVIRSLFPLIRPKGKPLTNIPLTPAQRDLIGLDKNGPPFLSLILRVQKTLTVGRHHPHSPHTQRNNYPSSLQSIPLQLPSLPQIPLQTRLPALRIPRHANSATKVV